MKKNTKATVKVGGSTIDVSGNFTSANANINISANVDNLQAAANELFEKNYLANYTYKSADYYKQINAKFSGDIDGCGNVHYEAKGSYILYCPLTKNVEDIVVELDLADITLTYTSETEAKVGGVSVNILNNERIDAIDTAINDEFITNLLKSDMFDGINPNSDKAKSAEQESFSADDFVELLQSKELANFIDIAALDNMPTDYTVTLKEIDQNDGLYEGLEYEVPYESKLFFTLDIEKILSDALGNLYSLVSGSMGEKYSDIVLELPISIGASFKKSEGIRAGKYELSIKSPGSGWVAANSSSFNIEVNDGKVTSDIGGTHQSGIINLKTIAPLMLEQVGCGGCSWLLGMCGTVQNGSLKLFNQSGVLFNHEDNEIEFTNADLMRDEDGSVQTVGIEGSKFMLIDRDRTIALARALYALGKGTVNGIIGGISYDDIPGLILKLTDTSNDSTVSGINIDGLLTSIIAMGDELGGFNVPSILEATSDKDGLVKFTPKNNVTLKKLAELTSQTFGLVSDLSEAAGKITESLNVPETYGMNFASLLNQAKSPVQQSVAASTADIPGVNPLAAAPLAAELPEEGEKAENPEAIDIGGQDMSLVLELLGTIGDRDNINVMKNLIEQFSNLQQTTDPTDPTTPTEQEEQPSPANPGGQSGQQDPPEQGGPQGESTGPGNSIIAEDTDSVQAAMELLEKLGGTDIGFAAINMFGLSDGRFPVGNYILVQTEVPEGHFVNPIIYTFRNMWIASNGKYETRASMDLGDLMSNEQFAAFAKRLSASSETLAAIFENLALGVDTGLNLVRAFIGTGKEYDTEALLSAFEHLSADLFNAAKEEVSAEGVPEDEHATEDAATPDAEAPKTGAIRKALTGVVDKVVAAFIPKAVIIYYISNMLYASTGDLFESAEEAYSVLKPLIEDEEFTLSNLFGGIKKMMDSADNMMNGKVTKEWYFYNLSSTTLSDSDVALHYILSEMLPEKLAKVIERAIADELDVAEEVIESIMDAVTPNQSPEVSDDNPEDEAKNIDSSQTETSGEEETSAENSEQESLAKSTTSAVQQEDSKNQEQTKETETEPATSAADPTSGSSTGSNIIGELVEGVEEVVGGVVKGIVGGVVNTVGGLFGGITSLF